MELVIKFHKINRCDLGDTIYVKIGVYWFELVDDDTLKKTQAGDHAMLECYLDMEETPVVQEAVVVDTPIGNGITAPYWKHDCDRCVYLGSQKIEDSCYDFYYCEIKDSEVSPYTGIIREGNDPDNNSSYLQRDIMRWSAGDPNDVCSILKSLILTKT